MTEIHGAQCISILSMHLRCQVLTEQVSCPGLCRLCMTRHPTHPFYTPCRVYPQDSLPLLAGDDITARSCTSCWGPMPLLDESTNQKPSLLDTPLCMHPKSRTDVPRFILLPAFLEETSAAHEIPQLISCLQYATWMCPSTSFTWTQPCSCLGLQAWSAGPVHG